MSMPATSAALQQIDSRKQSPNSCRTIDGDFNERLDFNDTLRWGLVKVQDSINAPKYEAGDILHVDLQRDRFLGDGCYAVEIGGQQMIRFIQARPGGLFVFAASDPASAYQVPRDVLRILGMVTYATTTRRVG